MKISAALGLVALAACAHAPPAAQPPRSLACGPLTEAPAKLFAAGQTVYAPASSMSFGKGVELAPLFATPESATPIAARALFPPGEAPLLALLLAPKDAASVDGAPTRLALAQCGPKGWALAGEPVTACDEGNTAGLMASDPVPLPGGGGASSLVVQCGRQTLEMEADLRLVGRAQPGVPVMDPKGATAGVLGQAGYLRQQFLTGGGGGEYARKDPLSASGYFPLGKEVVAIGFTKDRGSPSARVETWGAVPKRPHLGRPWDEQPKVELWLFFGRGAPPSPCEATRQLRCARLDREDDLATIRLQFRWVAGAWPTAAEGAAALKALGVDPSSGSWFRSGEGEAAGPDGKPTLTELSPAESGF